MGLAVGLGCALGAMWVSDAGQASLETICRALQTRQTEARDWQEYYKYGSYVPSSDGQRIEFAPVFVSPSMQWAVPNSVLNGPPVGPPELPLGFHPQ